MKTNPEEKKCFDLISRRFVVQFLRYFLWVSAIEHHIGFKKMINGESSKIKPNLIGIHYCYILHCLNILVLHISFCMFVSNSFLFLCLNFVAVSTIGCNIGWKIWMVLFPHHTPSSYRVPGLKEMHHFKDCLKKECLLPPPLALYLVWIDAFSLTFKPWLRYTVVRRFEPFFF